MQCVRPYAFCELIYDVLGRSEVVLLQEMRGCCSGGCSASCMQTHFHMFAYDSLPMGKDAKSLSQQ